MARSVLSTEVKPRGFTLIEAMVATLVFAIGMMAVITMEFSALRAYSASRDLSVATDLGEGVVSMMRTEAGNWSQRAPEAITVSATALPLYDAGTGNASAGAGVPIAQNLLHEVISTPWQWQVASPAPLSELMTGDTNAGRFCVYVRGGAMPLDAVAGTNGTALVQTQVAVIYPNKTTGFATADCSTIKCEGAGGDQAVIPMLDPTGTDRVTGTLPPLEALCGWRAVYMGALISR